MGGLLERGTLGSAVESSPQLLPSLAFLPPSILLPLLGQTLCQAAQFKAKCLSWRWKPLPGPTWVGGSWNCEGL